MGHTGVVSNSNSYDTWYRYNNGRKRYSNCNQSTIDTEMKTIDGQ